MIENYLTNLKFEFIKYQQLGSQTLEQLSEEQLHWQPSVTDNSIAIIIKHLSGNMKSRWTNFLTEDGEKPWRNRDGEFENPPKTKDQVQRLWHEGWQCLFQAIEQVSPHNFHRTVQIRNEEHTLIEAFNRQLAHYAMHVGQIIVLAKMQLGAEWKTVSIAKGDSQKFNDLMFGKNC